MNGIYPLHRVWCQVNFTLCIIIVQTLELTKEEIEYGDDV